MSAHLARRRRVAAAIRECWLEEGSVAPVLRRPTDELGPCVDLGGTAFTVVSSMSAAVCVRLSFAKKFTGGTPAAATCPTRRRRSGSRASSPAPGPPARVAGRARAKPAGSRPVPPALQARPRPARPGPARPRRLLCAVPVRGPPSAATPRSGVAVRPPTQPFDSVHRSAFGQRGSRMLSMTRVQLSPPCPFSIARW